MGVADVAEGIPLPKIHRERQEMVVGSGESYRVDTFFSFVSCLFSFR